MPGEAKSLNTSTPSEALSPMAAKTPGKKKGKRKRKMRLSLKQSKMNTASDKYSDSLDGRPTLDEPWVMHPNQLVHKPSKFNVKCAVQC